MNEEVFPSADSARLASNVAAYSVSELAGALKRTLETTYDHVRLRGEISKITRHSSGHIYLTLKDDKASIDGVIWKGQVGRLLAQPESGLEVIVTGKITTFPASSKYQIVIEAMEVAGVGALLAQLERVKQKLMAEGLFNPAIKKVLPFAPRCIGIITSPTGAVIRDILHRIRDRWPCRVVVWPVVVQGDQAAIQVIDALRGFSSGLKSLPRPDVIIVARGGGSVEDLWPFNNEALARAVHACPIPIISAIGHETDTTLIDFVADRRAPTPTAAAEMATPVIGELRALTADLERRRHAIMTRLLENRRERLTGLARALPKPSDLINTAQQLVDYTGHRLTTGLIKSLNVHGAAFAQTAARFRLGLLERPRQLKTEQLLRAADRAERAMARTLTHAHSQARLPDMLRRMSEAIARMVVMKGEKVPDLTQRLHSALVRSLDLRVERLRRLDQLRQSLDPDRPLDIGFARVNRRDGTLIKSPFEVADGDPLVLSFKGDQKLNVVVSANQSILDTLSEKKAHTAAKSARKVPPDQGSLF